MSENRIIRERILAIRETLDSGHSPPSFATPKLLGVVFDGGSIPIAADRYFLVHPVELDGSPCEACPATAVADTSAREPVLVLGPRVPVAGDFLEAFHVAGRWVAESGGGSPTCLTRYCVVCGATETPVDGAVVSVKDTDGHTIGTATTDATGCTTADIDVGTAGSFTVVIDGSGAGLPTTTRTMAVICGSNHIRLCSRCEDCVLPTSDLTVTFATDVGGAVVRTLVYRPIFEDWFATVSGPIAARLFCQPGDAYGWKLEMTYNDPVFAGLDCDLLLEGTCDPPNLSVIDLGACVNFEADTGLKLPIVVTS